MEKIGVNWALILAQLLSGVMIVAAISLALIALWQLRHRQMSETARGIWAALIILVPLLGPIAFWLTRPGQVQANERTS